MRYFVTSTQGQRSYQEDTHAASGLRAAESDRFAHAFAVFDGHSGHELSTYCAENFGRRMSKAMRVHGGDGVAALRTCLQNLDASGRRALGGLEVGTTACAVLVVDTAIVTANVGDSRAILVTDTGVHALSRDHKPDSASEMDRILREGGFVTPASSRDVPRVMGRLALSRALGDWKLRPFVIDTPDFTLLPRSRGDRFVVLATDGLWDVMSSEEVGHRLRDALVARGEHPKEAMASLMRLARHRGSEDNITIMIAMLTGDETAREVL